MQLPEELQQAIKIESQRFDLKNLQKAYEELSLSYRHPHNAKKNFITSDLQRCAYLLARLPATYAAITYVLQELVERTPTNTIKTLLDVGCGPGSASWAAQQIFPTLHQFTLLEKDLHLLRLGQRLAASHPHSFFREAQWLTYDLEDYNNSAFPTKDLVILSYCIGELSCSAIPIVIEKCWQAAEEFLIIIEPGTPAGFDRIRQIRKQLINLDGTLLAPCPHMQQCPDWCHFATRLERSQTHRHLKMGALNYEDEKFSYLIFTKKALTQKYHRIIRHPTKHSGHVSLKLCTAHGDIAQTIISKKNQTLYKTARQLEWGDTLDINVSL